MSVNASDIIGALTALGVYPPSGGGSSFDNRFTAAQLGGGSIALTDGVDSQAIFDTAIDNALGEYDLVTGEYQPTVAGLYEIVVSLTYSFDTGASEVYAYADFNGATFYDIGDTAFTSDALTLHTISKTFYFDFNGTTDVMKVWATGYFSAGTGSLASSTPNPLTFFSAKRIK